MNPTNQILQGISEKLHQLKTFDDFQESIKLLQNQNSTLAEAYNMSKAEVREKEIQNETLMGRIEHLECELE